MYNINLNFLHSKEIDNNYSELQTHCDLSYKNCIAQNLLASSKAVDIKDNVIDSAENMIDEGLIVELNCNGLIGHNYCVISDRNIQLNKNDYILVESDESLEIALVSEIGDIVRIKRLKYGLANENLPLFIRKADEEDLKVFQQNLIDEAKAKTIFKEKMLKHNLEMKLVDVHYQFDKRRLFFFYTSDGRVDFREFAKDLASIFRTRIELRQIGVRDESKRIGGMGSCGREFCCAAFLPNFKRISTHLAIEQNSFVNLAKSCGPCGKLKCCLSFENEDNIGN